MIRDLATNDRDPELVMADVVVVGAGIAGLTTACRLAEHGRRVVVLESGAETQADDHHPLNRAEQSDQVYAGAEQGRFRCLGGTSTRWGGAMLPFIPEDMAAHPAGWATRWGIPYDRLLSHLPEIERRFRLPAGSFEDTAAIDCDGGGVTFVRRYAKWPPFKLRNVAVAFADAIAGQDGPRVWLNATVTDWNLSDAGRLDEVSAQAPTGRKVRVRAACVVIAAGAIESTRLLLLIDRSSGHRLFAPHDVLGRYLVDHLSAPIATLEPTHRYAFNDVFGFRFERGAMRNLRFEAEPSFRARKCLPAAFAHVAFESVGADGFQALRNIYRDLQKRGRPAAADLVQIVRDLPWFAEAAWRRFVRGRLLYPRGGKFSVHLVAEQKPEPSNRITLSESAGDTFGLPIARIAWRVRDDDQRAFQQLAEHFVRMWRSTAFVQLAQIKKVPSSLWSERLREGGGIYHPAGTIRIGSDPHSGVVDDQLRCFSLPNVHVVSTATFPVVGGANPTLMMMLYARHVADEIHLDLGRGPPNATSGERTAASTQASVGANP